MRLKTAGSKVLVGGGPERQRLRTRYSDACFLGCRENQSYARTLADADVMVFPSRPDTFGLVMLEAMACGTPVAAYDVPSPIDVIEDGITGCLDRNLDRAVSRALMLSRATVQAASQHFNWPATAAMFQSWLVPCGQITSSHPPSATSAPVCVPR